MPLMPHLCNLSSTPASLVPPVLAPTIYHMMKSSSLWGTLDLFWTIIVNLTRKYSSIQIIQPLTSFFLKDSTSFMYSCSLSSKADTLFLRSSSRLSRLLMMRELLSSNTVWTCSGQWNTVLFSLMSSTATSMFWLITPASFLGCLQSMDKLQVCVKHAFCSLPPIHSTSPFYEWFRVPQTGMNMDI